MSLPDFENMSDEDFAKLENPGAASAAPVEESVEEDPVVTAEPGSAAENEELVAEEPAAGEDAHVEEASAEEAPSLFDETSGSTLEDELNAETPGEDDATNDDPAKANASEGDHTKAKQSEAEEAPKEPATAGDEGASAAKQEDPTKPDAADAPTDGSGETASDPAKQEQAGQLSAEDAYTKIMAPFRANGKDFVPKDPDEVIRLMQMGAGYAKKMEALRPNLKMMRMLENKDLLNEDKLNFLIDLNDRNPAAIQKLLHDSKIDPLDLDTAETPKYTPTNHAVSDEQFSFQETLQDVTSAEGGQETVKIINQSWDKASKEAVFEDPKILPLIHEQRTNGIYDRIVDELGRQKILGNFKDVPFIHAYKAVGDYLHERGELIPVSPKSEITPDPQAQLAAAAQPKPREMVETRTATPRTNLANDDRAARAAATRSIPAPAKKSFDPINMSDEEIMAMSLPNS